MENNETEIIDSPSDTEITENQTEGVADETTEDVEDLKRKLEEAESKNRTLEAQKEHFRKKSDKKEIIPESPKEQSLSVKDTLALVENKVSTDDFDEVVRVAKILGKSVSEALKDSTLKSILSTRVEERRSADVAIVKGSPKGASKITGESLLEKAETTGEVPDTTEGLQALFQARLARKLGKR